MDEKFKQHYLRVVKTVTELIFLKLKIQNNLRKVFKKPLVVERDGEEKQSPCSACNDGVRTEASG